MPFEDRFGYQWSKYCELNPIYESQFRSWLGPITPEFIRGKRVLDAGCGMGRNSYWCLKWGAQTVTAFDNEERILLAARNTVRDYPNARVERQDILNTPYRDEFDFVFCVGVIQFLQEPQKAVENLVRALKPGGTLLLWVYAREGNETMLRYVDPFRKHIASKLPPRVLDLLTYSFSIPLYIYLKTCKPQQEYFEQIQAFGLRNIHLILFDHFVPPYTHYYTEDQARDLAMTLHNPEVTYVNNNSWTITGTKPRM